MFARPLELNQNLPAQRPGQLRSCFEKGPAHLHFNFNFTSELFSAVKRREKNTEKGAKRERERRN